MPNYRNSILCLLTALSLSSGIGAMAEQATALKGEAVFGRITKKAKDNNWNKLPISELMGKIAQELVATPYVASTLELSSSDEICSANLEGLDCVTFFESTLDLARMIKKGKTKPTDLLAEIRRTRYREGRPGDYSSRLHYTTDWFVDNQEKGVVKILSDLPGSEDFKQRVGFMSEHPQSYPQLAANAALTNEIKQFEVAINKRHLKFVPIAKVAAIEPLLKTGDIVGVCTNIDGLDIVHTGLILRTEDGVAHFMDASSKKSNMKVTIEPGPISQSIKWSQNNTGAMFARPLEP